MDKWIRDLINSTTSGLRALIDNVWQRLTWVYNVFVSVFFGIRAAWNDALSRVRHYVRSITRLVSEIALTLYWITWIYIPQRITAIASEITRWAAQQIQAARDFARGLVDGVIHWATTLFNEVKDFAGRLSRWIVAQVNEIISAIRDIASLVYMLLTDPKRMATWLIDAVIAEFLRWLDRNFDRLFNIVRERSIHYTLRFADRIESLLERLI